MYKGYVSFYASDPEWSAVRQKSVTRNFGIFG